MKSERTDLSAFAEFGKTGVITPDLLSGVSDLLEQLEERADLILRASGLNQCTKIDLEDNSLSASIYDRWCEHEICEDISYDLLLDPNWHEAVVAAKAEKEKAEALKALAEIKAVDDKREVRERAELKRLQTMYGEVE
jgi:hypothetical protein